MDEEQSRYIVLKSSGIWTTIAKVSTFLILIVLIIMCLMFTKITLMLMKAQTKTTTDKPKTQ